MSASSSRILTAHHLQHLPEDYTSAFPGERRTPLQDGIIHYAGQHVAMVVADTPQQAQTAASLLKIEYEAEEPVLQPQQALDKAYQPKHFAKNFEEALQSTRGNPDQVQSAHRIDVEYQTPIQHHNPIEPSATLASWDGDQLTLHDSTRWIYGTRLFVSTMLGIEAEKVHVVCPYVGGAFGSKGFLWQHVALTAVAAKLTARPVRLVLSREQMFTSVGHRPQTSQSISLAADDEGHLQLLQHISLNGTSPVAHFVEPAAMISRHLYSCPVVRIEHRVAPVNITTPCFMRAPGEAPGLFALESAMDELAAELNLDPLVLRLRNYAETDEEAERPWSSKQLRLCYQQGAERFGWTQRPPKPACARHGDWLVGWGMSTAAYPGRRSVSIVHGELDRSGRAVFSTATQEIGTGTRTAIAQIAADTLGIPLHRVAVEVGDSHLPPSPVHGASQATATVGPAVLRAASDLRHELILMAVTQPASSLQGAAPNSIVIQDGVLRVAGQSDRQEHYADVLARMQPEKLEVDAEAKPGGEHEAFTWTSFGAHFAEVLVHAQTGEVRVSRWVGVFDAGRILNPVLAKSQMIGGILFGVGMALLEETHYDPHSGMPLNASLSEYLVPTSADTPYMDISFVEMPDLRFNPLGVRGLGELGMAGAAGAIGNAVFHATGKRIRKLPITPQALMQHH